MKYLPLLIALCLYTSVGHTQVLNDQINVEIRMAEYYGNSDNDATSTDEQSMQLTTTYSDAIASFTYDPQCIRFDCHVPCTQSEDINAEDVYVTYIGNWGFDAQVDFHLHAWGSEDELQCQFDPGDEDEFMGLASNFNLSNSTITSGRTPIEWHTDLGSADGWIFDNSNLFNLKPKVIWAYRSGGRCDLPLNFGTINNGETKTHTNTNRSTPGELLGEVVIGHTNQISDFHASPEAYYSFTLTETSMVSISTDNAGTDYDTFIGLQTANCGEVITTNDDAPNSYSSRIVAELEAGNYIVFVEGFEESEGDFELSITVDAVVGTTDLNPALPINIGPNPTDGLLRMTVGDNSLLDDAVVEVYNLQAQLLQKTDLTSTSTTIDLSTYPAGTYLVRVITPEGQLSKKILVY